MDAPESRKDIPDALCYGLDRCQRPAQSARGLNADGQTFRDVPADLFEYFGGAVDVLDLSGLIVHRVHHVFRGAHYARSSILNPVGISICGVFSFSGKKLINTRYNAVAVLQLVHEVIDRPHNGFPQPLSNGLANVNQGVFHRFTKGVE